MSLAGIQYFGKGTQSALDGAASAGNLEPNLQLISAAIRVMSSGERVFVASLVSFHNSQDGGRLLRRVGVYGLADLGGLDLQRRSLIATLLLNYTDASWSFAPSAARDSDRSQADREGVFERLTHELAHFQKAPSAFLSAWKVAVALAGVRYFGTSNLSPLERCDEQMGFAAPRRADFWCTRTPRQSAADIHLRTNQFLQL